MIVFGGLVALLLIWRPRGLLDETVVNALGKALVESGLSPGPALVRSLLFQVSDQVANGAFPRRIILAAEVESLLHQRSAGGDIADFDMQSEDERAHAMDPRHQHLLCVELLAMSNSHPLH